MTVIATKLPDKFYNYVQDTKPGNAKEGETWYDSGANESYVYDGSTWVEISVTDHSELGGIGSSDHHTRPSPGNSLTEDANNNFNVDESGINHGNLAGISSSDHHERYTDSEAKNASIIFSDKFAPGFLG